MKQSPQHGGFPHLGKARRQGVYKVINEEVILNEGYMQPDLTARALAKKYGLSAQDISAVSLIYFGGSFPMLLQRLRVNRVCRMLANKAFMGMSCEEIGRMCGFASRQSLYNAFHRQLGTTPMNYRKKKSLENE